MRCHYNANCGDFAGEVVYDLTGVSVGPRCHECKGSFIKTWREQGFVWKPYRCSEPGCPDAPAGYAASTLSIALVIPQCEPHHQRDWRHWPPDMYWNVYRTKFDVTPSDEKYPTPGKPLCRCSMTDIMRYGCKCGGR